MHVNPAQHFLVGEHIPHLPRQPGEGPGGGGEGEGPGVRGGVGGGVGGVVGGVGGVGAGGGVGPGGGKAVFNVLIHMPCISEPHCQPMTPARVGYFVMP